MEHPPKDHLEILAQLAREYQQKYKEMEQFLQDAKPESASHQLRLRAELTTDRFRAAQQILLTQLVRQGAESEDTQALKAAVSLCRCFDEMRILFQMLMDYSSGPEGSEG